MAIVDAWGRHANLVRPEVDAVVRTALRRTVARLFCTEARLRRGDEAAVVVRLTSAGYDSGFSQLFELYFEAELRECLSDISAAVLWELANPSPRLVLAMRLAATPGSGGITPVARHFGLTPRVLQIALYEIQRAFSEFFDVPVKTLRLRYLYR